MKLNKFTTITMLGTILLGWSPDAAISQEYKLSVSLESASGHIRNQIFEEYAKLIREKTNGEVEITIFGSASQFSDAEVPAALAQGGTDMAAPLYVHLGKYVPEAQFADLPMAYGADEEAIYKAVDGKFGSALSDKVEKTLGVKVLGRSIGLGHAILFTTEKSVQKTSDIEGLKLRVPGGAVNVERFRVFGANPVSIPWPDASQALQQGTIDGMLSTDEPVRSISMWESGLRHVFIDNESYFMYMPLVSAAKWNSMPEEIQRILETTWDDMIDEARIRASERWKEARSINEENGIEVTVAKQEDLEQARNKLMEIQSRLIGEMKMDEELIGLAQSALRD